MWIDRLIYVPPVSQSQEGCREQVSESSGYRTASAYQAVSQTLAPPFRVKRTL